MSTCGFAEVKGERMANRNQVWVGENPCLISGTVESARRESFGTSGRVKDSQRSVGNLWIDKCD
jgi:hypothetical protein